MGMDAHAYLFYGFVVENEDYEVSKDWNGDWEEYYNQHFNPLYKKWSKGFTSEEREKYWNDYFAFQQATNAEIRSTNYECFFVYIKTSLVSAYWTDSAEVTNLEIKPEWTDQLKDFCEKMNIPYQEPKWRLVATYD